MPSLSLYDLAVINRADAYTGLIEEPTALPPEFTTFEAVKRPGTVYEITKRTALPSVGFRQVNTGATPGKSTFKKEVKEMFFVDAPIVIDEAAVKGNPGTIGDLYQIEAEGVMRSVAILLGQQTWYGTSADANGFSGIRSQLAKTVAVGGTTNSTSAYLCWMDGKHGVRYDVGQDGQFAITAPQRLPVVDFTNGNKTYYAYQGNLSAWIGLNVLSNFSAYAVTGITTHTTANVLDQALTDDKAEQLHAQIPAARRNNLRWFMNKNAQSVLRRSRTTINVALGASYQPAGAGGQVAFSPMPDQLIGYPITLTESILDTETNS